MAISENHIINYTNILKEELIPALGCTEPTSIAYVSAKAREVLDEFPRKVTVKSSGNIIKNVKGAVVPNSGNLRGIKAAAIIGIIGGNPEKELEVLTDVTKEDIRRSKELIDTDYCKVELLKSKANLHIIVKAESEQNSALVEIIHTHTNIVRIEKNNKIILEKLYNSNDINGSLIDRSCLNVRDIKEFADTVELTELRDIIRLQIKYNGNISEEGLNHYYGANVGSNILRHCSHDIKTIAKAATAAGSDARMSGCILPVIINSGSGNQGITVSLPVIKYARYLKLDEEQLIRALIFSNLIAIHQKTKIGRLSAYCGVVSAACGSGAGITYLYNGTYEQICSTITNTLANVSGMICDGAKPSCAAKIASAVDAAIMAHELAMDNSVFQPGEGIVKDDIEDTIKSVGQIGGNGMRETDQEILKVMLNNNTKLA